MGQLVLTDSIEEVSTQALVRAPLVPSTVRIVAVTQSCRESLTVSAGATLTWTPPFSDTPLVFHVESDQAVTVHITAGTLNVRAGGFVELGGNALGASVTFTNAGTEDAAVVLVAGV